MSALEPNRIISSLIITALVSFLNNMAGCYSKSPQPTYSCLNTLSWYNSTRLLLKKAIELLQIKHLISTQNITKVIKNSVVRVFIFALFPNLLIGQGAIVFRYNSDPACYESVTDVESFNITVEESTDSTELDARGIGGWGFSKRFTTLFNHDSSLIESTSDLIITFSGSHAISGEIWFKTNHPDGGLLSWIDSTRASGVSLYLQDSIVTLNFKFRNEHFIISDNNKINLREWTLLNWFCRASEDSIHLGIIKDGLLSKYDSWNISIPPIFSSYISKVRLGKINGEPSFNGELHAANIKNYFLNGEYSSASPPFDGSGYFGIPNYLDNHLGIYLDNIDERVTESPTPVEIIAFVPYQNDDYVPQGLTNSYEDEFYSDSVGYIYISMYNKTKFGASYQKNSIIVELDPANNYGVRRCFMLNGVQGTGHNGGISFFNNNILVATNYKIGKYQIPDYENNRTKYQTLTLTNENTFSVISKASFMTFYRDSVWVGDYRENGDQIQPYLYGYPIDSLGNVITSADPVKYRIPYQTQGVAWTNNNNIDYLFINTTNGGNNHSILYRIQKNNLEAENIFGIENEYFLPSQVEDLSFNQNGDLITVSESGAKYYQIGAGWEMFFPFIFIVNRDTIFSEPAQLSIKNNKFIQNPGSFLILQNFPNPFNGNTNIPFEIIQKENANLEIINVNGRVVKSLIISNYPKGNYIFKWNARDNQNKLLPSGQYFYSISSNKGQSVTKKMLHIK